MSLVTNWFKKLNNFEIVYLTFLLVSQFYYFYRWAFSYGSNFSPPSYSLTPNYLQYAKYLIALVFLVWLVTYLFRRFSITKIILKLSEQKFWLIVIIFIAYQSLSLLKFGLNITSFGVSNSLKMLFVIPFILFIPFIWADKKPFDLLKVFLVISVVYHAFYELIILIAYFFFHRLPGLAFSNLLPRFGGGWDDPNSFAAFMLLPILVLFVLPLPKNGWAKLAFFVILIILSLLFLSAYSVTGFIGLIGSLVVLLVCRKLNFYKTAVLILGVIFFFSLLYSTHYLSLLYEAKFYSSAGHLAAPIAVHTLAPSLINQISDFVIGPFSQARFHENIYLQMFLNYGLIGLVLFVAIQLTTIYRAFTGWLFTAKNDTETKNFFLISFIYLGTFAVMNIGIPLFQVFPVNLFVWVLIGLVWVLPTGDFERDKSSLFNKSGKIVRTFLKGQ